MGEVLGIKRQNIYKWTQAKDSLIPWWWSDRIEVAAKKRGIRLPKPKKAAA